MLRCGKELPEKYADHWLTGDYSKCRECHIKPDWLLIYRIDGDVLILTLMDTGTYTDCFVSRAKATCSLSPQRYGTADAAEMQRSVNLTVSSFMP